MAKKVVSEVLFKFRVVHNCFIFFILLTFLLFDNDLKLAFQNSHYLYCIMFFALAIISYYFFYTCGHNPGYVDIPSKQLEMQQMSDREPSFEMVQNQSGQSFAFGENIEQENRESLLSSRTGLSRHEFASRDNSDPSDEEERKNKSDRTEKRESPKRLRRSTYPVMPDQWFCEVCNIYSPYRSKHCHLCERCVHKFDHHCVWLGSCVGELNHRRFYIFLALENAIQIWAFIIAQSGLHYSWESSVEAFETQQQPQFEIHTPQYVCFMIIAFIVFLATIFTGLLMIFHTYLIITNQSTWEYTKRNKIDYLRIYPKDFLPFSKGAWENIKMTFFHGNKFKQWELPPINNEGPEQIVCLE